MSGYGRDEPRVTLLFSAIFVSGYGRVLAGYNKTADSIWSWILVGKVSRHCHFRPNDVGSFTITLPFRPDRRLFGHCQCQGPSRFFFLVGMSRVSCILAILPKSWLG